MNRIYMVKNLFKFIFGCILFIFMMSCLTSTTQKETAPIKLLAITIDDLPVVSKHSQDALQAEVTKKILAHLVSNNAPAIGFVNEYKLYNADSLNPFQVGLLQQWIDAKMELGNHTFAHKDYHMIDFETFKADVVKGEKVTNQLLKATNQHVKYFRHPFLHTGNTIEKKKQLTDLLKEMNYETATVTVDNSDWIYGRAYDIAMEKQDVDMMENLGKSFVKYIGEKIDFYESNSLQLFERTIHQVLLLHANTINADYLDDLILMIQQKGYTIAPLSEVQKDKAYQSKNEYVGRAGMSWIHRWAITQKFDKSIFKGEPLCPKFVQEYSGLQE